MYPPKYVIRENNELKIVTLWEMNPAAEVVAEVIDDTEDDPLVAKKIFPVPPCDFMHPDNMFGEQMRLSHLGMRLGMKGKKVDEHR